MVDLLKPGSQRKELSFAGVEQVEGGALTTGQLKRPGSGAEVLLAAKETKGELT